VRFLSAAFISGLGRQADKKQRQQTGTGMAAACRHGLADRGKSKIRVKTGHKLKWHRKCAASEKVGVFWPKPRSGEPVAERDSSSRPPCPSAIFLIPSGLPMKTRLQVVLFDLFIGRHAQGPRTAIRLTLPKLNRVWVIHCTAAPRPALVAFEHQMALARIQTMPAPCPAERSA
jgi:hypothetical protein